MPNIPAIKAAVCGKKLARSYLVLAPWKIKDRLATFGKTDPNEVGCRCFVGELLHEAGVADSTMLEFEEEAVNTGESYHERFPELQEVYGLDHETIARIIEVNDTVGDSMESELSKISKRTNEVLATVFGTSCEVEPDA